MKRSLPRRKWKTVRYRGGRAWQDLAKATVRMKVWRSIRNPSGVWDVACGQGQAMNWGGPTVPAGGVEPGGGTSRYKAEAEILDSTEGVGAGHSTEEGQDNITWPEGRPRTLVMRTMTEAG